MPVFYKDVMLDCGYRLDLVVEDQVVVEIKSVGSLAGVHEAQLLSYLKLGEYRVGLLINFNVKTLKYGIRRMRGSFFSLWCLALWFIYATPKAFIKMHFLSR